MNRPVKNYLYITFVSFHLLQLLRCQMRQLHYHFPTDFLRVTCWQVNYERNFDQGPRFSSPCQLSFYMLDIFTPHVWSEFSNSFCEQISISFSLKVWLFPSHILSGKHFIRVCREANNLEPQFCCFCINYISWLRRFVETNKMINLRLPKIIRKSIFRFCSRFSNVAFVETMSCFCPSL